MSTYADEATKLVFGDRNATYNDPDVNLGATALMWQGYLQAKGDRPLDGRDVCQMVKMLKAARDAFCRKQDNIIDSIGYDLCIQWIEKGVRPIPQVEELAETIESVCTGERLMCQVCGDNLPCLCDKGLPPSSMLPPSPLAGADELL